LKKIRLATLLALAVFVPLTFAQTQTVMPTRLPEAVQAAAIANDSYLVVPELPNLGLLKNELKEYANCTGTHGCYAADLTAQTSRAAFLLDVVVDAAKKGEKIALVLDIDETSLSNMPNMEADDYGFIAADFNNWVMEAKAPAIPGTLALYNEARKLGVAVFFITGRDESQREATVKNLKFAGYEGWSGLALRTKDQYPTTIAYKSAERAKIKAAGYRLVMSMGDQLSDLDGDSQAEISVKLPNPFYYLP